MTPEQIAALPYRRNVGIMLIDKRGYVFVGQRRDNHSDAWQMPQGGIDPGETPEAAAWRELEEETGVAPASATLMAVSKGWVTYDLPADLVSKLWQGKYRGQEQKWYLMRFEGAEQDVNIQTEHPEFSAWAWMRPADLIENIVPFKRAVYHAVLNEFASHLPE